MCGIVWVIAAHVGFGSPMTSSSTGSVSLSLSFGFGEAFALGVTFAPSGFGLEQHAQVVRLLLFAGMQHSVQAQPPCAVDTENTFLRKVNTARCLSSSNRTFPGGGSSSPGGSRKGLRLPCAARSVSHQPAERCECPEYEDQPSEP